VALLSGAAPHAVRETMRKWHPVSSCQVTARWNILGAFTAMTKKKNCSPLRPIMTTAFSCYGNPLFQSTPTLPTVKGNASNSVLQLKVSTSHTWLAMSHSHLAPLAAVHLSQFDPFASHDWLAPPLYSQLNPHLTAIRSSSNNLSYCIQVFDRNHSALLWLICEFSQCWD